MRDTHRLDAQGYASTPRSWFLAEANLFPHNKVDGNEHFDIRNLITDIQIIEDINSPFLEAEISVGDTFNLQEKLGLCGGEKLFLNIQRNQKDGKKTYKHNFYISEVYNFKKSGTARYTYVLKLHSNHLHLNQLQTVQKPFKDTLGGTIKKLFKHELQVPEGSLNISTNNSGIVKGIFPRLRPVHACYWLMRQSFDDGTPFYLYETLQKSTVHFKSYKELASVKPSKQRKYKYKSFTDTQKETPEGYEEERIMITKMSSPDYGKSSLMATGSGAYASTLHELDIASKSYKKIRYSYEKNKLIKLNDHKPFTKTKKLDKELHELNESKQFFISKNSKAFEDLGNYYSAADVQFSKAIAHLENLNYVKQEVILPGDFELSVGHLMHVSVYRNEEGSDGAGIDKEQSGDHLITRIVHMFGDEYNMDMTIQKDSSERKYD